MKKIIANRTQRNALSNDIYISSESAFVHKTNNKQMNNLEFFTEKPGKHTLMTIVSHCTYENVNICLLK